MAWSSQSATAAWSGQPVTSSLEPERANAGTNLLAQLGLVPSQAMPTGAVPSGALQNQTMLSTTVAPARSQLPQQMAEQGVGRIEAAPQGHMPFSYTGSSQRCQGFSPARDTNSSELASAASTTPSSTGKQFRFNPNAMPFVFQSPASTTAADSFGDSGEADYAGTTGFESEEDSEPEAEDAAAVSAAVACAVIGSPPSGPTPAPCSAQYLADSKGASPFGQAPPELALPSSRPKWRAEPQAPSAPMTVWPPAALLTPLQSSQEAANGYSTSTASPASHPEVDMSPMLLQLEGIAQAVALTALPSPDAGPSLSPRGVSGDFSLSATAS